MTFTRMLLLSLALTTGCAQKEQVIVADPIWDDIAQSANRISQVAERLGRVEATVNPPGPVADFQTIPEDLQKRIDVRWNGRVEPIVVQLTREAGWSYGERGRWMGTPVLVNVNATDISIADALKTIGHQLGTDMGLVISEPQRVVELVFDRRTQEP